jgi:4-hydroxyphenylpyruvate dioxygenase-like putative hemolysin
VNFDARYKHFNRLKRMCVDTCILYRTFLQDFLNRTILKIKKKDIIPNEAVKIMKKGASKNNGKQQDFFPIHDFDYVEYYVGNAKQTSYFLSKAFGFKTVVYAGLETGQRDKVSYVLEQKKTRFIVSGSLKDDHPISDFVKKHGEGVKDIALVEDVEKAYMGAISRGLSQFRSRKFYG